MMQNQAASNDLEVKKILLEFWRYRLLFILIILFSLTLAFLYTKYVSRSYTISSTILIKTKTDNASSSSSDYIDVNGMMNQDITMTNEINILQSTPIIRETLDELGVTVSYYSQEHKLPGKFSFSLTDIYTKSPFIVIFTRDHVTDQCPF